MVTTVLLFVMQAALIAAGYALFRNDWTYKQQIRLNHKVGDYNRALLNVPIEQFDIDEYEKKKLDQDTAYAEYYHMFFRFWDWDVNNFIYTEELKNAK